MSNPIVIAIANQKGGEGKTTTSLNLAHGIALHNHRTLLIDIDPQGNSSGIFLNNTELEFSMTDLFQQKSLIENAIYKTKYENLSILPSNIKLAEVELNTLNVEAPYILRDAIQAVSNLFDFIVIDCPPSLSIFTVNALVASNFVVIPLQAEKFSIDGIKGLQNTIESIKRRINPNLQILGALITQLKSNTILTKTILPVIQNYFPVFKSTISSGVAIGESHLAQQTIYEYSKAGKQAGEYLAFVKEVINGVKK